ncbi:MAG: helix-turn-helix transcriptional regulator [Saccharofermentans sp.]|nr:helix-turn-helix transcriptional regulator [Saccharofermentans sp.]
MDTSKILNYRMYVQREEEFMRADYSAEIGQYSRIKNGDIEGVRARFKIARQNFLNGNDGRGTLSEDPLRNAIYHLVASAAVISRLCIDAGMDMNTAYTLSDIYINKADEAKSVEQVVDLIADMQIDYATRMYDIRKEGIVSIHVRRALDHIYNNLNRNVTVAELAEREALNPEYFSRLFARETGKKVSEYITDAKIRTAMNMLAHSDFSIMDIALSLGYSSQSAFTTVFKKHTFMTPKKYRDINKGKM